MLFGPKLYVLYAEGGRRNTGKLPAGHFMKPARSASSIGSALDATAMADSMLWRSPSSSHQSTMGGTTTTYEMPLLSSHT